MKVLEIGCGEGGVLKVFLDKGCTGVGVEPDASRLKDANKWLLNDVLKQKIQFIHKDIFQVSSANELGGLFDIIILKDVIEHIYDKQLLFEKLKMFLKDHGVIFFGFPPWQMPFGGHQQMCKNGFLSKLPWLHLLPASLYRWILKIYHEPVNDLLEIRKAKLSIENFIRLCKRKNFKILDSKHYLVNPIYKWKFGYNARTQFYIIRNIPFLRNYFTTSVFYLVSPNKK